MLSPHNDWPLSLKMAVLVVAAALLPMAVATWSDILGTRERLKQNASDLLAARCDQLAGQLDAFHRTYERAPRRVARLAAIEAFCRQAPTASTADELVAILETWPAGDANFRGLAVVGPDGECRLATAGIRTGIDLTGVDYVQTALTGRHVISEIHVAEITGQPVPTIAYASPIGKPGEPVAGIAVAWVRAEGLWSLMKKFNELSGPGSFAVLFDQYGIRVGHTYSDDAVFHPGGALDPALVQTLAAQRRFGARTQELLEDVRAFPEQFERALADAPDQTLFRGFALVDQQSNYGVARRCETVPWTLFYMLPEGPLNAQISSMILNKALFACAMGLLAVVVGLVAARALTRPLSALAGATETIARGDLSVRLPALQRDEIGRLGGSFNKMAEQLQAQAETLRRATDASLLERERLLSIVTGSARVGLVVVNPQYHYLFANRAYSDLFRLDENLVGRRVPDVLAAGWAQIQPQLDRAFAGERVAYELSLPPLAGESLPRCFSVVYEPRCEDTRVSAVVVVVVDITDRRRTEDAMRASEGRLRLAQQVAQIGTFEWNMQTGTGIWTPEFEALYGLSPGELPATQKFWEERVHPEDREQAVACVERALVSGLPTEGEWRARQPDGTLRWLAARIQAFYDEQRHPLRLAGVNVDVTRRRRAESIALEHQARLEGIVDSAMDGIISVDESQRIVLLNSAAERMFGCRQQDVVGQDLQQFIPERFRARHPEHIREFARTGVAARSMGVFGRIYGLRSDGQEFPIEASISQIQVEGARLFTVTCRDVTEQVKAAETTAKLESQLRQSQRMEAFGQLAGGVAHDFNNLLTIISGYSDLLLPALPADDDREMLERIRGAAERASTLTRQLLAFSRQQVLEPKVLDLNVVIQDTRKMLLRLIGEDIEFSAVLRPDIRPVKMDPGQLEQIIMNLAINSRDAMPQGGKLTIETSMVDLDETFVRSHLGARAGRYILMAVSDTGVGIAPEVKSRIFEPFFTTKEVGKGTGLGLAVVHGIVRQSGGSIDVYSEQGTGTTFKVYLPSVAEGAGQAERPPAAQSPQGNETILLVEDEAGVREFAARALRSHGYTVLVADGGEAALQRMAAEGANVRLLVTDVVMPGMGGPKLAETLQASHPDLKVLFLSGYTDDAVVRHGVLRADVAFLQKPFSPKALANMVRQTLDRPSHENRGAVS